MNRPPVRRLSAAALSARLAGDGGPTGTTPIAVPMPPGTTARVGAQRSAQAANGSPMLAIQIRP